METIVSVPTETREAENDSYNGAVQQLFSESSDQRVYKTLFDVQPELMRLYTGDYKHFTELVCPNCQNLAIEPKDCSRCGEQICKSCQDKRDPGLRFCYSC